LRSDVAADGNQRGQAVASALSGGQARFARAVVKEVAQEVGSVVHVDEDIHQFRARQPRFDELLERFDLVRLVGPFQRGEVELAFLRIDGKGRVAGYSAVHFSSDGGQLCPELNEVLLALQRQTQLGVVLLAFFGPGDAAGSGNPRSRSS